MAKMNCWEFKKCGRGPGGAKIGELGVRPAAVEKRADGIHGGVCGGGSCWAIAGTLCGGKVQGSFASKVSNCMNCEFYVVVHDEETEYMVVLSEILKKLR